MKRLVAVSYGTQNFCDTVDTNAELDLIQSKDKRLNRDTLVNYEESSSMGAFGGFYMEKGNDEKIRIYVVDSFGFKDIDSSKENVNNALAYVATRVNPSTGKIENYQYVTIMENEDIKSRNKGILKVEGMTLEFVGNNFTNMREIFDELKKKYDLVSIEENFA